MAGPLDFLLGTGPDAAAKASALERLMQQRQLGILNQYSGDKVLAPIGRQMVQDVGAQEQAQALAQHHQAQLAQQAAQQKAALGRQTAQDAALEKFRNSQLGIERGKLAVERQKIGPKTPGMTLITGEGGAQFFVDPRNPQTAAIPVTGPGGTPIAKGHDEKPLTESQGQAAMFLDQAQSQLGQAQKMGEKVLPASGWSGLGEAAQWKARAAGFPQLASNDAMARQSILLAVAEPIIRAESGAAVPAEEVRRLALRYIPTPGESTTEQHRKLTSLIAAVGGVMQKLPDWKKKEFQPFQAELTKWASDLAGGSAAKTAPKGATHFSPSTGKYYDAQGNEMSDAAAP